MQSGEVLALHGCFQMQENLYQGLVQHATHGIEICGLSFMGKQGVGFPFGAADNQFQRVLHIFILPVLCLFAARGYENIGAGGGREGSETGVKGGAV